MLKNQMYFGFFSPRHFKKSPCSQCAETEKGDLISCSFCSVFGVQREANTCVLSAEEQPGSSPDILNSSSRSGIGMLVSIQSKENSRLLGK